MAATVIDGKALAAKCKARVAREVEGLSRRPGLAVIIVGDNQASRTYVNSKRKDCDECGIYSEEYALPADAGQAALMEIIESLNGRADIDGILCQLPLPEGYDEEAVLLAIDPDKDVDGFHPINAGRLLIGEPGFVPCTPKGVMRLLEIEDVPLSGKHAVVVGRSNIVGKPMALLLLQKNCTVTIAHSRTQDLAQVTRGADILVVAVGKAGMITGDMIKPGAVVLDVGINRVEGKVVGDVDFASAAQVASRITPVPGGVGAMTIAMLMENAVEAAEHAAK